MNTKKSSRLRRARKTRSKIRELGRARLSVSRSARHMYAQIIDDASGRVVTSASTVEAELRSALQSGGNVSAAAEVGKRIAVKAKQAGISKVAFDRSGFRYHGRVKALAEAARENGLEF